MISRRDLFKMLGAAAASPVLKPLTKLMPETYTTYLVGEDALISYNVKYAVGPRPSETMRIRNIKIPTFQKAPNPEFVYWRESNV